MNKFKFEKYDYTKVLKKKLHYRYIVSNIEYESRRTLFGETDKDILKDYMDLMKKYCNQKKFEDFDVELEAEIIMPHKTYKFNETNCKKE